MNINYTRDSATAEGPCDSSTLHWRL